MPEDRTWVLDGRANVEVVALRVVGRDEEETAIVGVVDARRVHESPRTGRLECLGELPDLERTEIRRQGHQILCLEKIDHLLLAAFVCGKKGLQEMVDFL